jgi:hypothetical protein
MLHKYYVIYSFRYYPQFHVTAVALGTYYPWIRGHYSALWNRVRAGRTEKVSSENSGLLFEDAMVCGKWLLTLRRNLQLPSENRNLYIHRLEI